MKRPEPEFDQWTDQNHVPYRPDSESETQMISNGGSLKHSFNLIWHGVLKMFKHSQSLDVAKKDPSRAFLSWPRN